MPFKDRHEAGLQLAQHPDLAGLADAAVVSLPRGSVTVAVEVARAIGAPLDVMPVEELSSPGKPGYVVGAVAENAIHVINSDALEAMGVTEDSLAVRVAEATALIARMAKIYRGEHGSALTVADRVVVVVDDGSATAPALEAVSLALKRRNAAELWLASPVAPCSSVQGYAKIVTVQHDPEHAEGMELIGLWYDDYAAPSDEVAAAAFQEFARKFSPSGG